MDIKKLHSIYLHSEGITTDSRKVKKGQLFFALKGTNFNGNEYAKNAIEKGAGFAIINEQPLIKNEKFILVKDVLKSMQELAIFHRKYLNIPVLAITGSNGKTTTKELISSVLQKRFKLGFTKGNLNNHIGVPLTLLSFNETMEFGVVEMGANHIGEIAELCKIAQPDYGVITNIGMAHIEGFGSYEGVIKAKTELYKYVRSKNGKIFVNGDDELLMQQSEGIARITYGKNPELNTSAEFIGSNPFLIIKWDNYEIETNLVGSYNFDNALAAIAVGGYFDVPKEKIVAALAEYLPKNNRSQLARTENNTLVIDAYNANPTSMSLAIKNFRDFPGKEKVLILGDMFELGTSSDEEHKKIIELTEELAFSSVFFVGETFYGFKNEFPDFQFFKNVNDIKGPLVKNKLRDKTILLKASRGIKLEQIIELL